MRPRLLLIGAALALALGAPAAAQQTLNVRDADIRAFIQDAARVTGRTFIIDDRVKGKVSVVTDRPLSRSEYFEIVLSTLRANGLVAVPTSGGALRIQPVEGAAAEPGSVGRAASRNSFVTEVFRLRNIDAASAVETLKPLVSKEGSITANRAANSLVVADYADNIQRVRALVARIDRTNDTTEIVALKNAGAREVAESLQKLAGTGGGAGGPGGAAAVGSGVVAVAIDRSNSIALRGDPAGVAKLASLARELDRTAESGTEIRVIYLKHADAAQLLPVLQQLVGQPVTQPAEETPAFAQTPLGADSKNGGAAPGAVATPTPTPTAAPDAETSRANSLFLRGPVIVTRFTGANAIVIGGNADTQRMLGEVIRQLDVAREQVLVEAIIVEISDNAAKRLGVQFLLGGDPSSGVPFLATNYSNAVPNILTLAGAYGATRLDSSTTTIDGNVVTTTENSPLTDSLQQAAAQELLGANGGFGGTLVNIGSNAIFGAIINAVKSDTASNILSTPHVLALDNHEAHFLVGQEIPITTGEALSDNFDNAFRTIQRENVGIKLDIKPQINEGGEIKLVIRQEVSSIAGPVSEKSSELILNKREFQTTLTAQDGQILAIGGLLDDNERRTIERVPLLSDIPVLGELFKSRSRARSKTNLMVFIRPTIIHNAAEGDRMTQQRYGYMRDQQLAQNPGVEPSLDALVRDYMGAVPPIPPGTPVTGTVIRPQQVMTVPGAAPATPAPPVVVPMEQQRSSMTVQPVEVPPSEAQP
ncbi:MAG TPA: type II secretion system secretin GspD [Sphingomonas sp.]|nr:type II secretion system secretin GspD [Sphingomonas sp.]